MYFGITKPCSLTSRMQTKSYFSINKANSYAYFVKQHKEGIESFFPLLTMGGDMVYV